MNGEMSDDREEMWAFWETNRQEDESKSESESEQAKNECSRYSARLAGPWAVPNFKWLI